MLLTGMGRSYLLRQRWVSTLFNARHHALPARESKLVGIVPLVQPLLHHAVQTPRGVITLGSFYLTHIRRHQAKPMRERWPNTCHFLDTTHDSLEVICTCMLCNMYVTMYVIYVTSMSYTLQVCNVRLHHDIYLCTAKTCYRCTRSVKGKLQAIRDLALCAQDVVGGVLNY